MYKRYLLTKILAIVKSTDQLRESCKDRRNVQDVVILKLFSIEAHD